MAGHARPTLSVVDNLHLYIMPMPGVHMSLNRTRCGWAPGDSTTTRPCYHCAVNSAHRKTLEWVFSDPAKGNIDWSRIESMLKAAGCRIVEGAGSSVTFEFDGRKMTLHRPHPGKEALRYRVLAVREFLTHMRIKP